MRRGWGWALVALMCGLCLPGSEARAAEVHMGFASPLEMSEATWGDLSAQSRMDIVERRFGAAAAAGGSVLRLGQGGPEVFTEAALQSGSHRNWQVADAVVGAAVEAGISLCITVREDAAPSAGAFTEFLAVLVERYDGDTDFGLQSESLKGYEHPDVDGSGSITSSDWGASDTALQAWATGHALGCVELGGHPTMDSVNDYAAWIAASSGVVRGASESMPIWLGSVLADEHDADAVGILALAVDGADADIDGVSVALGRSTSDFSGIIAVASAMAATEAVHAGFSEAVDVWLGSLRVGSASESEEGICEDSRCSERTQAASVVRLVVQSVHAGLSTVVYEPLVEVVGNGETGHGEALLTLALQPPVDPSLLPLRPRPAYAVWGWLAELLGGVDTGDVTRLDGTPQNVHAYHVLGRGWVVWFDWFQALPPGAEYGGETAALTLEGVGSPSLRIQSLWPEALGDSLADDGGADVSWDVTHVAAPGGVAEIPIGQDPLWIEESDQVIAPSPDADTTGGERVEPAPPTEPEEGAGCAGAEAPVSPWLWWLCLYVAFRRVGDTTWRLPERFKRSGAG